MVQYLQTSSSVSMRILMSSGVNRSRIDCFARYDKRKKVIKQNKPEDHQWGYGYELSYETSPHSAETGHKMHAEKK